MKYLIIEPNIGGHRLEYYNHLTKQAAQNEQDEFIFVVRNEFESKKTRFEWPEVSNVTFRILSKKESELADGKNILSLVFNRAVLLWKMIQEFHPDRIFLMEVIFYLPFVPLYMFLFPKIKIRGIIFLVYSYRWKRETKIRRWLDAAKFWMMAKCSCFDKIFIINDTSAPSYLNRLFNSNHFLYTPDPLAPIEIKTPIDIRQLYNIEKDKILLCQMGGLGGNKGTQECLKAFLLLPLEDRKKYACVLAGKINPSEKESINNLVNEIGDSMQIVLKDEFCSYDFMGSLCKASDFVLLTYKKNEGSSGILGIAAEFKTPVISTNKNLLGKLIRRYKLGFALDDVTANGIAKFLSNDIPSKEWGFDKYIKENTIENFTKDLFK